MKQQNIKYIILFVALAFSSCSEWLDEVNPNEVGADSYWTNLAETNSTLTATYSTLLSDKVWNTLHEAVRADIALPGLNAPSYPGKYIAFFQHTYTGEEEEIARKWEMLYSGIYRANQTIAGLTELEGQVDEEEWTSQMAQARFLRGLFHFYLYASFNKGQIIIHDRVPQSDADFNKGISPAADVFDFFIADLEYAYENLLPTYPDGNRGRASKATAATILGTAHLYEYNHAAGNIEAIDKALPYFEDVVLDPESRYPFALERDTLKQFTNAGEFNSESIFEVSYSETIRSEMGTWVEDNFINTYAQFTKPGTNYTTVQPNYWLLTEYLKEELDENDPRNWVGNDPNQLRGVSLRTSAMLAVIQDEQRPYYNDFVGTDYKWWWKVGYGRFKHFTNHDIAENENLKPSGQPAVRSGKNLVVNRLGDVYLMLAECYIYKGRTAEALSLINELRERWALKQLLAADYPTAADLLTRLQDVEKPLETSLEGHCIRWFDLRRWGKLKTIFEQRAAVHYWPSDYRPVSYSYPSTEATSLTDVDPENGNDPIEIGIEVAAQNFDYERHAWYPIPPMEAVSNAGL